METLVLKVFCELTSLSVFTIPGLGPLAALPSLRGSHRGFSTGARAPSGGKGRRGCSALGPRGTRDGKRPTELRPSSPVENQST